MLRLCEVGVGIWGSFGSLVVKSHRRDTAVAYVFLCLFLGTWSLFYMGSIVYCWVGLIPSTCKLGEAPETFTIWAFFDPLYKTSLLIGTNLHQAPHH